MNLKDSVKYHCQQLKNECEDYDDALGYVEDTVSEIADEFPNELERDVEDLVKETLKELYGED